MKKATDLQPWLEYFNVLRTYEQKGFLEIMPEKHEAYITQPALHAITPGELMNQTTKDIHETVLHIRAYAGWKSQEGPAYLKDNFAVHVVHDDYPHDLICTLLVSQSRRWQKLMRKTDCVEVISYMKK